ncbi:WD repeat and HMG-box DNA-binding protein 1 [Cocos nucifera]|uniref:WD repeat and HMG-box DNA-binding protein 1 n=1 Tax=Cocos nucifera TaxID=13894 RepID=A0A8K0MUB4_COCNU|nr:WD repeat and HMG-box DNA-binding protein 1 [Cocos nucifera]
MKARSVRLREAHKGSGSASHCSILWDLDGRHLVTASASDPSVSIHDVSQPSKPAKVLQHHRDGVTALALNANSSSLATGSIDHSVKLYSFPDGEFQSNVTRFTLPIRSLAFNKSASLLAAAGDDDGIKLIATLDSSISKVLKGHKGSVTGLAFDPTNEFLASVDAFGTVIYWELSSGKAVHTLKAIAPNCDAETSLLNVVSWSPDGETLAVPGLRNDVVMYDRDTAEKLFTLKGDHERPVCFLSWSPNGKYIATSALDKQVLIWDVDLRQDIERQKFDERICCLSWKPNGNALAVIDVMGKFGSWEPAVPSCMKSPTDGAPSLQAKNANGLFSFDEDDEKPSTSGSLDDAIEESHGESAPLSRKRLRKHSVYDDNSTEDSDGEEGLMCQIESRKRSSIKCQEGVRGAKEECVSSSKCAKSKMQEAFQPGSTPAQTGKRRFLAYNMLGSITTIENEGYSHIEVDFHDTGRGPRVSSMTDYFGFTMASLNENGSVFANPCKGEKNMSTLMYRPFSSWASNSEWSMRLEGEEVKVVALGTGWVAAVTSFNFLRIFTEGGLQRHVLCLNGPVVTALGFNNLLAVVTHASDCLPSGDQMLEVKVFDISEGTQPVGCHLPLTPCSYLTWFGFSEEGQLSAYDSKGVLRVFSNQYGGSWLPVFSASKARKSEDENYWIVGLNASKLFCIICKSPESFPSVMPKPVLTLLSLSFPLASSDLGADDLENEFIMSNLHLSQIQKKIEEFSAAGLNTTELDDEAFNTEAAIDRCILRLIANCCNSDKLVRATELVKLLSLEKSVKGAIKLVTALKLPMLAERFNSILEERLFNESKGTAAAPSLATNGTITNNTLLLRASPAPEITKVVETASASSSPTLPQSHFSMQEKVEKASNMVGGMEPCKDPDGENEKIVFNPMKFHQPINPFAKQSNDQEKAQERRRRDVETCKDASKGNPKEGVDQVLPKVTSGGISNDGSSQRQSHRPVNPFAKASSNHEKSSLLDSIKKMKKADHEKNEKVNNKKARS